MFLLPENPKNPQFPHPSFADEEGFLGLSKVLNPVWILDAYSKGIFVWEKFGSFYTWWSPDPRGVMYTSKVKIAKSMRPYFNQKKFELKIDYAFEQVIRLCEQRPREGQRSGWITPEIISTFVKLHKIGLAHSFEAWKDGRLVGGLYGLGLNNIFSGESMFALEPNASKFAYIAMSRILDANGIELVDCQIVTPHLRSLGCSEMPRDEYLHFLEMSKAKKPLLQGNWGKILYTDVF